MAKGIEGGIRTATRCVKLLVPPGNVEFGWGDVASAQERVIIATEGKNDPC